MRCARGLATIFPRSFRRAGHGILLDVVGRTRISATRCLDSDLADGTTELEQADHAVVVFVELPLDRVDPEADVREFVVVQKSVEIVVELFESRLGLMEWAADAHTTLGLQEPHVVLDLNEPHALVVVAVASLRRCGHLRDHPRQDSAIAAVKNGRKAQDGENTRPTQA
jgi:hypothetical protein